MNLKSSRYATWFCPLVFASILIVVVLITSRVVVAAPEDERLQSTTSNDFSVALNGQQINSTTNSAPEEGSVLVLIPNGFNLSALKSNNESMNFSLFKLNSDVFVDDLDADENVEKDRANYPGNDEDDSGSKVSADSAAKTNNNEERRARLELSASFQRDARGLRKINLLGGMWNKPKASPLYLINGTVCRFVNGAPICTTLSTTGLLPASGQVSGAGGATAARPAAAGLQSGGSSVQFANNPQQQPRPSAVLDDESQEINVEGSQVSNSTMESSMLVRGQQQLQQPQQPVRALAGQVATQGAMPGMNYIVKRRPLNLLALRRPVRQFQKVGGRLREIGADRGGRLYTLV